MDYRPVIELLAAVLSFWGIMWNFRREDRREREAIRHQAENKQAENHKENQDKLDLLVDEFCERPNHIHTESPEFGGRGGPLTAEGIRYRPKRNGKPF